MRDFGLAAILAFVVLGASSSWGEDRERRLASVAVSVSADRLPPGSQAILGIKLELAPNEHANSNRPRNPQLIPTTFFAKSTDALSWGRIHYPKPTQVIEWYSVDPLSVFANGAEIQALFEISEDAPPGEIEIGGTLRVQVCDEKMCYPSERIPVSTTVAVTDWQDE